MAPPLEAARIYVCPCGERGEGASGGTDHAKKKPHRQGGEAAGLAVPPHQFGVWSHAGDNVSLKNEVKLP
jgi:hypothetical protein